MMLHKKKQQFISHFASALFCFDFSFTKKNFDIFELWRGVNFELLNKFERDYFRLALSLWKFVF